MLASFELGDVHVWSASGLYKAIKAHFMQCAQELEDIEGERLLKASTHWLRHTQGSHAANGRPGHAPVPIQIVRNNMGHASIATTSAYLTTERDARLQAMEGSWDGAKRRMRAGSAIM